MVEANISSETNRNPDWLYNELRECKQWDLIAKCWEKLEKKFQISPNWIDEFIIDFVTFKHNEERRVSHKSEQYLINLLRDDTEETLKSMLRYADFYSEYILANDPDYNSGKREIRNLRLLGSGPAILIIKLRDLLDSEKLDEETYKKMLSSLESYRVRLAVTGKPEHWKKLYKMAPKILDNDPLSSFLSAMNEIPDSDFHENFKKIKLVPKVKEKDFDEKDYLSYDWCRPILYRLQGYNADELSPLVEHFQIEHVMPFTYSDNWKNIITRTEHKESRNNIGNLTLVPSLNLNQQLSDKKFENKRTIANSYIEIANRFRLDESVWKKEKWTIDEIEERGEKLANKAIEIWPNPMTKFDKTLSK